MRLFDRTIRILLALAMLLAIVPVASSEIVCVSSNGSIVRPLSQCPVLAKLRAQPAPAMSCCHKAIECSKPACVDLCRSICHCEVRYTIAPGEPSKFVHSGKLSLAAFDLIAPSPNLSTAFVEFRLVEPGIVGQDSGPPRKIPRSSSQPRAPPVA